MIKQREKHVDGKPTRRRSSGQRSDEIWKTLESLQRKVGKKTDSAKLIRKDRD